MFPIGVPQFSSIDGIFHGIKHPASCPSESRLTLCFVKFSMGGLLKSPYCRNAQEEAALRKRCQQKHEGHPWKGHFLVSNSILPCLDQEILDISVRHPYVYIYTHKTISMYRDHISIYIYMYPYTHLYIDIYRYLQICILYVCDVSIISICIYIYDIYIWYVYILYLCDIWMI